jgi:hypothetical protein
MTLAQPKPSACSAHFCSTHFSCDGGSIPEPGTSSRRSWPAGRRWWRGVPNAAKRSSHLYGWGSAYSQKRVWTVSTPWASDSVVPASDWAGLRMFSKEWRIFWGSGWFESHLGHVFPQVRGFLASDRAQNVL